MVERLADYKNKLRVLRQIMSNKAQYYARINNGATVLRVVAVSLVTFMGFAGIPKVHGWISNFATIEQSTLEFAFAILVFILFVLVILHLVLRFGAKQFEAERAIVMLTHLANEIDDMLVAAEHVHNVTQATVEVVRSKYDTLTHVIPINSDKEFFHAKRDYFEKEQRKINIALTAREMFDASVQRRTVQTLVKQSPILLQVLETLRKVDEGLFVGGGVIRNVVWDYLHEYSAATPIDDVDVIYFDPKERTKEHDAAFEAKLRNSIPNLKWSVKNQARMHEMNIDTPYTSLEDAVSKWPETATAMAARLGAGGEIEVVAPHGFDDLFRLVVSPTPHFLTRLDRYRSRIIQKNWGHHWPRLRFFDLDDAIHTSSGPANAPLQPPTDASGTG
jgi:hypothetical protein